MKKATAGKWEIESIECVGPREQLGKAHVVVWDEDREGFQIVFRSIDFDDDESKANAVLAAAAPELLNALKRLVFHQQLLGKNNVVIENAILAISRAEGENL